VTASTQAGGPEEENAVKSTHRIRIALYTQQPFVERGLAAVLLTHADLELTACRDSLSGTLECLRSTQQDVLLVYLTSGISLADLREMRSADGRCQIVLWGQELGGEFVFQAMQLGVRSVLPEKISIDDFLTALRDVHRGVLCFERGLLENILSQERVVLSQREGQVVSLVAQGLKNKEIAFSMGITEGTVKTYLYRLFRKLGVNDRLDLALYGLKNLFGGQLALERSKDTALPGQVAGKPGVPCSFLMPARRLPGVPAVH
jgi:DNA-binding NarL/FixJ family response regulator